LVEGVDGVLNESKDGSTAVNLAAFTVFIFMFLQVSANIAHV